ncbi:MarR family winged helix-turn-helix transcriptional regulator [Corynebacterium pyruviciproducens]|uniref:MarR family transcriptional regulator n=1 Tax=Corynebacterium pyruviciproducens TaxID=598660 RepID=A0AAF1BY47_9CORY|nr:MarR family transcriptional regulator [Corynebacterium pyruviciproducens]WOT01190.1 MarR family transcriptional regulator [Corynebacterium pyruviciproducens]
MIEPHWLTDDEQRLWRLLLDAERAASRCIEETLQSGHQITTPEFSVLVTLSEAEERSLRLRDLCFQLRWDRSRTSHQVTRMERRGLVEKCKCEGDARGVLVKLTESGMKRLEAAAPDHVESVRKVIFDNIDPADVEVLTHFFTRVRDSYKR